MNTPPAPAISEELRPCPFCGGPGVIRDADEQTQFYVACQTLDCYCCVGESYDRDAMPDHVFRDREAAAAAWNRGVRQSCAPKVEPSATEDDYRDCPKCGDLQEHQTKCLEPSAGVEWQPIETAPKDGKARLVWCPHNLCIFIVSWNFEHKGWQVFGGNNLVEPPTHWQPLPSPPTAGTGKETQR